MKDPLIPVVPPPTPLVEEWPAWVDPCRALRAAAGTRHPVLLLSGTDDHPGARYSILAFDPLLTASFASGRAAITRFTAGPPSTVEEPCPDPFDLLRSVAPAGAVRKAAFGLPFAGGAIGYLGYGLRHAVEDLGPRVPDPLRQPDAWFGLYDAAALFDHRSRRTWLVAAGVGADDEARRVERASEGLHGLKSVLARAAGAVEPAAAPPRASAGEARLLTPRSEYLARVRRALDYIAAGDVYQVNLSHRIEVPCEADPAALFAALDERNPAPFAAYLDTGTARIVSASPERFLELDGRRATSSPIKGTRPRGRTAADDRRLADALRASAKDRAENVMIADLVRNDLGRVCEPGSVRVDRLCDLESFATVHHLVSTVTGRLRADRDRADLLRALFPGGSMTGAPKVRAMQIIDELEGEERGIYSGSIGYLSLDGRADFNIVIRTLVLVGGRAHLRVGGGIVADSDPDAEYLETLDKGRALLDVLGAPLPQDGARGPAAPAPRRSTDV